MLRHILAGCGMMVVTTAIHALATMVVIRSLRRVQLESWVGSVFWKDTLLLAAVVLALFVATLLEVGVWAALYLAGGSLADPETALYFSTVTFTTLGYGDVTLDENWRLLSSLQAANGVIMFGWTTAIVVAVLQRLVAARRRSPG